MNKKNLVIFGLVLANAMIFAFLMRFISDGVVDKTVNSYKAQGIDAYLE